MRYDVEKIGGKIVMSLETYEDILDTLAYDGAKRGERFPVEILDALLAGASPVKVFRQYRTMTQAQLARKAQVTAATISEIETGRKTGSVQTLLNIAEALGVEIGDVI